MSAFRILFEVECEVCYEATARTRAEVDSFKGGLVFTHEPPLPDGWNRIEVGRGWDCGYKIACPACQHRPESGE